MTPPYASGPSDSDLDRAATSQHHGPAPSRAENSNPTAPSAGQIPIIEKSQKCRRNIALHLPGGARLRRWRHRSAQVPGFRHSKY